jgi:putative addiction module CopG family antidote
MLDTQPLPKIVVSPRMTKRKTMNVSLTPELERSVAERVASGRYRNASEVVRAASRLLEKEEREDPNYEARSRPRATGDLHAE